MTANKHYNYVKALSGTTSVHAANLAPLLDGEENVRVALGVS
jgi:hypothetical protein